MVYALQCGRGTRVPDRPSLGLGFPIRSAAHATRRAGPNDKPEHTTSARSPRDGATTFQTADGARILGKPHHHCNRVSPVPGRLTVRGRRRPRHVIGVVEAVSHRAGDGSFRRGSVAAGTTTAALSRDAAAGRTRGGRRRRARSARREKAWPSVARESVLPQYHLEEVERALPRRRHEIEYSDGDETGG